MGDGNKKATDKDKGKKGAEAPKCETGVIRVEIGAVKVSAANAPANAADIIKSEAKKHFGKAACFTTDPKVASSKVYSFEADLTKVTQQGEITKVTIVGKILDASSGGLKAGNVTTTSGTNGPNAAEDAVYLTVEQLVTKSVPVIVDFAKP